MNFLEEILLHKRREVNERMELYPVKLLERSPFFNSPTVSLKQYLNRPDLSGIIAEIKRASPSAGNINPYINVAELSVGYMQAGASALSILTDRKFFKGSTDDLTAARTHNLCPILMKDFILDEYQILEARSVGADAVLLISSCLTADEVKRLHTFAVSLGLEVLLEVHSLEELERDLSEAIELIGVNSRDLTSFKTSPEIHYALRERIPQSVLSVAESGISSAREYKELRAIGYQGFLMGERFMRASNPAAELESFIREVHSC